MSISQASSIEVDRDAAGFGVGTNIFGSFHHSPAKAGALKNVRSAVARVST
jgi:hypothetical protein